MLGSAISASSLCFMRAVRNFSTEVFLAAVVDRSNWARFWRRSQCTSMKSFWSVMPTLATSWAAWNMPNILA